MLPPVVRNLLKPPRLRPGDTVAAVTLSWGGPGAYPERYLVGKRQCEEELGLRVVETRHALRDPGWIARNPRARADDLMEAFVDPTIHGIVSTIGGDDSIRILPYLDLDVLGRQRKIFMGNSDTTVTHFACLAAGLTSFYGPSVMTGFAENAGMHPYLVDSLQRTLFSAAPIGEIAPNTGGWTSERLEWGDDSNQSRRRTLRPCDGWRWLQGEGCVRGPLIGGCAEVLSWLIGTTVWPEPTSWDGAILFLETSEEAPPPRDIERLVRHLAAVGVIERIAAVLLGRPGGGELAVDAHAAYDAALLGVLRQELGRDDLPIVTGMDFGHTDPSFVLPYGAMAEVDCVDKRFQLIGADPGHG